MIRDGMIPTMLLGATDEDSFLQALSATATPTQRGGDVGALFLPGGVHTSVAKRRRTADPGFGFVGLVTRAGSRRTP